MNNAQYIINNLDLKSHPEGGYFKEIYRSEELINIEGLPERYSSSRAYMTSIYFLLKNGQISKFHKLNSDEIWYYHSGNPVKSHTILPDGSYSERVLGPGLNNNQKLQLLFPKNSWFAAEVIIDKFDYSLFGCAVAPGFEFEDFIIGKQKNLMTKYPQYEKIIEKLT